MVTRDSPAAREMFVDGESALLCEAGSGAALAAALRRLRDEKGLAEQVVVFRHGLKNAVLPILTISGWQFGRLFGGTVVIETIFLIPGMGRILIEGVFHRDYPLIQAEIVIIGVVIVAVNLAVDLLYGLLDPRIRYA